MVFEPKRKGIVMANIEIERAERIVAVEVPGKGRLELMQKITHWPSSCSSGWRTTRRDGREFVLDAGGEIVSWQGRVVHFDFDEACGVRAWIWFEFNAMPLIVADWEAGETRFPYNPHLTKPTWPREIYVIEGNEVVFPDGFAISYNEPPQPRQPWPYRLEELRSRDWRW